ncbi:MAG: hypothetical protein AAGI17_06285 [Planctomycetota bacterium]
MRLVIGCITLTLLGGCVETRVIRGGDRFMSRFAEGQRSSGLRQLANQGGGSSASAMPTMPTRADLTIENPDGSVTLRASSVRDLMLHIGHAIESGDARLFAEQVLSSRTRGEFSQNGMRPEQALAMLQQNEASVRALFERMPVGEFTPGLYLQQLGVNTFRLRARGVPRNAQFTFIDVIFEDGNYRLRWFGAE